MPPFFPNASMELYSCSNDSYDEYGRISEYILRDTVAVDIQPMNESDSQREFGKILQDTYKVYMNSEVEIHETDKIMIDGVRYELIGSIQNWNHLVIPHKKLIVRKYRKNGEVKA